MSRRRTKLRIVPDPRPARRRGAGSKAAGIVPGLIAGLAAVAAVKYLSSRRRGGNNPDEVGVLTAEVHSNGHSRVGLGSLDSFS